jgi:hypothetical protein
MADEDSSLAEPPYKKNLERLASLQDRLSKVQKTAESLLATVSGTGDYTDKVASHPAPSCHIETTPSCRSVPRIVNSNVSSMLIFPWKKRILKKNYATEF